MKFRQLGRTKLVVSEIGFGCWAIGGTGYGPTRDEESLKALETAWEHGVNFFDTADVYGNGHSETLLNQFFQNKSRDQFFVASKVGWDFYNGGNKKNFSPDYIPSACQESLKRLGLDAIDLYQLHNPNLDLIQSGEAIEALVKLKDEGKIRWIGISVHREDEALQAIQDGRVDVLQLVFNLLDQRMADKVFKKAKEQNIGIIVREPLACGLLSGKYAADHEFHKQDHRRRWLKDKRELDCQKVDRLKSIVATARLSLVQAALEYVLDYDAVSTVIPGAKRSEQVLENLLATEEAGLRIQEAQQLREIFKSDSIFQEGLK